MKILIMSIKPRYSQRIFAREKRFELRRTPLRLENGDLVIVYASAPVKAVVGAFTVEGVARGGVRRLWGELGQDFGIGLDEPDFDAVIARPAALPAARAGLTPADRREVVKLYRNGVPVRVLAKRRGCSASTTYRVLHHALVEQALRVKTRYIPSSEFAGPGAGKACLGDDGLFTYPPGATPEMLKAPAGLPPYLRALYDIPLLSREEEKRLFRKYNYLKCRAAMVQEKIRCAGYRASLLEPFEEFRKAAEAVRRILIRCNLRLVVSIAKRHVGPLAPLLDLVSEGNMCLIRAVECYDYTRNARFATYATWAVSKHFARVIPERNYRMGTFVTGHHEMIEATGDARPDPQERRETAAYLKAVIARAAEGLTEKERTVIHAHFGTDGRPARTLEEIGKLFGVTRERIRQIEARALEKLRAVIGPEVLEGLT